MRAETSSPSWMSRTPMVPRGWRRRSVGEPGLKIRGPSAGPLGPGPRVERDVRVTEDDQLRAGEPAAHPGRAARRRAGVVDHGRPEPAQVQLQRVRRAPGRDVRAVVVTPDRPDRGVGGQLVQDARGAHVARVQDEVRAAQVLRDRGRAGPPAARRMRVGQHDHLHGPILPAAGLPGGSRYGRTARAHLGDRGHPQLTRRAGRRAPRPGRGLRLSWRHGRSQGRSWRWPTTRWPSPTRARSFSRVPGTPSWIWSGTTSAWRMGPWPASRGGRWCSSAS